MKNTVTNIEKEIQLKILSKEELVKNLRRIGFDVFSEVSIDDYYYSHSGKFLLNKPYFRIRKINNKLELTFKKNINSGRIKVRKEIILRVDSLDNSLEFLEAIGLKIVVVKKMKVTTYKRGKDLVEIIKTLKPSQFEFVEIENKSEASISNILRELGNCVSKLNHSDFPKI